MHFHVRDSEGRHVLDAGLYREALKALETEEGLLCQISSEGLGRYDPHEQARCIFDSGCTLASVAWREMTAGGLATARKFYNEARERAVHLQHILYTPSDVAGLQRMVEEGGIGREGLCLLFVYGSYGEGVGNMPPLENFLEDCLKPFGAEEPLWFLCSFGEAEQACLLQAAGRGGHARVGFENNLVRCDGSLAASNAERVAAVAEALRRQGRGRGQDRGQDIAIAGVAETRALLGLSA